MKKTMIALAAFGALAGAAHAQSSVTLYGLADVFLSGASTKTTTPLGTTSVSTTGLSSGGLSGSRWGLRGAEDLGGGLKATFQLEAGFNADNGTAGAPVGFNRTSKVGLSGGFGSIEFGRQYTRMFNLIDSYDAQGTSSFSATNAYFVGMGDAVRWDNSVVYSTPSLGGFSASVQYAFGENPTPGVSAGHATGLLAGYEAGPFAIHGAYQTVKANGATPAVNASGIGASYDFGPMKLLAQVIHQKDKAATGNSENYYHLSVSVPVGTAGTFNVGFGNEREKNFLGAKTRKASSYGLEYRHGLSKRTTLYAALGHTKTEAVVAPATTTTTKDRLFGLGMRHSF